MPLGAGATSLIVMTAVEYAGGRGGVVAIYANTLELK